MNHSHQSEKKGNKLEEIKTMKRINKNKNKNIS